MTGRRYTPLGGFFHEGSVSTGTLRTQDLLRAFANEYERLLPFNSSRLCFEAREAADALDAEPDELVCDYGLDALERLADTLDFIAAEFGCRFGPSEGDGADFGFWQLEEELL